MAIVVSRQRLAVDRAKRSVIRFRPGCLVRTAVVMLAVVCLLGSVGCRPSLPEPGSGPYAEYLTAFYTGLAALQVGDDVRAEKELARSAQLVAGEPAGWANWGILRLRQRDFEEARRRIERARALDPQSDRIYYLLGLVATGQGHADEAIADLQRAVSLNSENLIATYQLAKEVERQGAADSDLRFQKLMQTIVDAQPGNLAAQLELGRVAAKRGDVATLRTVIVRIQGRSATWPVEVQQQFAALQSAAANADSRAAAVRTTFLRNVLMRLPEFRQDVAAIQPLPGDEAQPFTGFLRMQTPVFTPAPADTAMTFQEAPLANPDKTQWSWIGAVSLGDSGAPTVVEANGREVRLASGARFPFPGGPGGEAPGAEGIVPIDFNYDFKMDMVLAGAGGVRFFRQDSAQAFTDVTAQTKLPRTVVDGTYTGAWAVDIEADGDLDLVLAPTSGAPVVLRNNGDGSFSAMPAFVGVSGVRQFVWADLNGDGNPDASLVDGAGRLHIFVNERSGHFTETPLPAALGDFRAITTGDATHNGRLDLLGVQADGSIVGISASKSGTGWKVAQLARVAEAKGFLSSDLSLHAVDLDNNGAIDLLLTRTRGAGGSNMPGALVWLGDDRGSFLPEARIAEGATVFDAADVSVDGRLDLLGLTADSQPLQLVNQGTKNYRWQIIRPRAKQAVGDQRINSFGVGGEIEVRSGLLVQLQPITSPQVHFGLGVQGQTDVARILWPNGSLRAEFAMKADQQVVTEQRLKGSCPFLFAYDGKQMSFVKDAVPWGSAIGLRIDNLGSANIAATEEWYKIDGSQLRPRDGHYDLRITGELWETYYYDALSLMVVDHPAGSQIYTDERFIVPAAKPRIFAVGPSHPVAAARDDDGVDVRELLSRQDGKYLDNFGRGQYQGVTRDHYVEVDLGDDLPASGPIYLVAKGWLHPSDSSINVAISQGGHTRPRALSLEIPDGRGGWMVARRNLGFPAGRNKTCIVDLSNIFPPGAAHLLRLRTNLEIYWDSIEWAQGLPQTPMKVTRLSADQAELRYRGYSAIHQENESSPEIPDYEHLAATKQIWRDLEGYYTRYGDVRELLATADDRYVIMNAGDELAIRFAALDPPAAGWIRDYVIAGDGWIKDGDYNSTDSKTVLPLPHHDRTNYDAPAGRLEDEWVYRQHPDDWQKYQLRYVTSQPFNAALTGASH